MIDRAEVERLEALLAKATPGPWQAMNEYQWDTIIGDIDGPDDGAFHYTNVCQVDMQDLRSDAQRANAALIPAMHAALPALLALARAVQDNVLVPREAWQPIETAPRDGKLFLGWVSAERWSQEDGGGSGIAHDTSEHDFCRWREMETGGFYENMMGQIGDAQDITHWMPLPLPPIAAAPRAGEE